VQDFSLFTDFGQGILSQVVFNPNNKNFCYEY